MAKATLDGVVLAQSDDYQYVEGNVYFPPASVKWEYLKDSDRHTTCPWKGLANYHHVAVGDKLVENAAWSYPEPKEAAKHIAGHVAFDRMVDVER